MEMSHTPTLDECKHCGTFFTGTSGGMCSYCHEYTDGTCYEPQPYLYECPYCKCEFETYYDGSCDNCDIEVYTPYLTQNEAKTRIKRNILLYRMFKNGNQIRDYLTQEDTNQLREALDKVK
jgi:hypothetical protein